MTIYDVTVNGRYWSLVLPRDVYDILRQEGIDHDSAADAEGWCEIAYPGESLEALDEGFLVEVKKI